jgi:hypothetical protein
MLQLSSTPIQGTSTFEILYTIFKFQISLVRFKYKEITDIILRSFYEVYNDNKRKNISANQCKSAAELQKKLEAQGRDLRKTFALRPYCCRSRKNLFKQERK